jgi:PAS domain S-box-containing protein
MGFAISGIYNSAMTAVHLIPQTTNPVIDGLTTTSLTLLVAVVVLVLLLLAFLIPYLLRYKKLINTVNENTARIHAMMDTSQDAFIQMNSKGNIVGWSSQAQHVLGWTNKEAIGQKLANLIIPPQFREAHKQGLRHFLASSEGPILNKIIEVEALHQEGHNFPIELTISFIKLADGFEFNALVRDISQRKQAEEKLILANEELAFQNEEKDKLAYELILANKAKDKLILANEEKELLLRKLKQSQKMEALGKLTGGIAHEYNNMLGIMLGYSELLKSAFTDNPKLFRYASQVQNAGNRAAKLTNKLLTFSQRKTPNAECINLNTLVQQQHHMLEKTLTISINLVYQLHEDLWHVWLDSSDMEDAILNVCINALHAMSNRGQLTIETRNKNINQSDATLLNITAGDYVLLSFTDTGCGFDKETKEKIFDPFFTTKGQLGSGLGLSIVYGFVQNSGGVIDVYSVKGEGTQFTFYFPRYHGAQTHNEEKSQIEILTLDNAIRNNTILLVDDEPDLLEVTRAILTSHGFTVFCAADATEALSILEHESMDIMISDVIMPRIDGYQLAAIVRQKYPDIKIQLVSGFSGHRNVDVADIDLQQNLLRKPVNSHVLLERIRKLLDEKI